MVKKDLQVHNTRSGYVSIAGLPNVGKSTLINRILGARLMAVSDKPQTTRNKILGIFTTSSTQIVFTDTPGYHSSSKEINKYFVREAVSACRDADVIVYIFDAKVLSRQRRKKDPIDPSQDQNIEFIDSIKGFCESSKLIPVLSKIDLIKKAEIAPVMDHIRARYGIESEILQVSSPRDLGVAELITKITNLLPQGPFYYPEDEFTDRDMRFLCAEIIREKIFKFTHEELPYSAAVKVIKYEEKETLHRIFAEIYLEKDSQKSIVLGANGSMIKRIGTAARIDIEKLTGTKVYLELFVKVKNNWTKDPNALKEFGYK
jgi:GTP-binding protein Era